LFVLTAAHCVDEGITAGMVNVHFDTLGAGAFSLGVTEILIAPGWNPLNVWTGSDLALLRLAQAVIGVGGYSLYTGSGEIGAVIEMAGYGQSGVGATGATLPSGTRRWGMNTYETTATPFAGSSGLLIGDFDNGLPQHDALAILGPSYANLGLGAAEVMLAPGDSGGPTFIGGQLAGIHSFAFRFAGVLPDVDNQLNFTFGEMFADTRISSHAAWIEAQMVPEPATVLLSAFGLALLWISQARARRRNSASKPHPEVARAKNRAPA
jgi:hypothetical protein